MDSLSCNVFLKAKLTIQQIQFTLLFNKVGRKLVILVSRLEKGEREIGRARVISAVGIRLGHGGKLFRTVSALANPNIDLPAGVQEKDVVFIQQTALEHGLGWAESHLDLFSLGDLYGSCFGIVAKLEQEGSKRFHMLLYEDDGQEPIMSEIQ
jgi:hypothetical protein